MSPIDKSSTIIAIAFAVIFLGERLSPIACIGVLALTAGIGFTLEPGVLRSLVSQYAQRPTNALLPDAQKSPTASWIIFALASAIFAALTSILGKIGITGVDSNLGTAIRTSVVLLMAWIVVALHATPAQIRTIPLRDHVWIAASGIATTASWLCYYRALQLGEVAQVAPVDKLSVVLAALFAVAFLGERPSLREWLGLGLVGAGVVVLVWRR